MNRNKKNLMIISYDLPPHSMWGVASNVDQIVKGINGDYNLDVVSRSCNSDNEFVTIPSNLSADRELIQSPLQPLDSYVDFEYLMSWNYLLARKIISERKNAKQPDLVHNHNWMTFPAAKEVAQYFKLPIVSSLHFLEKQYLEANNFPTSVDFMDILSIETDLLRHSSRLIVFGKNHKDFVLKNYDCDEKKIIIIPHGVESNGTGEKCEAKEDTSYVNITFAGRLVPEKGLVELLDAVYALHSKYPHIKLNIAGKGRLEEGLKTRYGHDFIKFHGFLSRNELYELYSNSDIFCFPSYTETFGLTPLEAAAKGLPIITSKGNSVECLFQETEALFVDVHLKEGKLNLDVDQLYLNLEILITNEHIREEYANNALHASKRYSVRNMLHKLKETYDSLLI